MSDDARGLIAGSQRALEAVYPPEEIFSLTSEELVAPNVQFLVARLDGRAVGCIALVDLLHYGEIKRLYVDSRAQGHGIGRRLVEEAETAARDLGLRVLRLETGPELAAALTLYKALGYAECAAFGDYAPLPCSLFLEKRLD